ncbi:MAG: SRPBCC family protein [Candidatus Korobacteraceae bacterium]
MTAPAQTPSFSALTAIHASGSPTAAPATAPARPTIAALPAVTRTCSFVVHAAPDRVFPLLCPVREYEWIPTWRADLLHTVSGVAEEDCVFRTEAHAGVTMTWVISRYEPPARIEFTCFAPDHYVFRLRIVLVAVPGGTELIWTHRWLATAPGDTAFAAASAAENFDERMAALQRLLAHYLHTGTMLPHP